MKRFKAYDPKEYIDWKPDPEVMEAYSALSNEAAKELGGLSHEEYLNLYRDLLRVRYQDTSLKRWVKQGKISKAWLGTGEEAVTVGNLAALGAGDLVGPMIRNAGALILKGMPLEMSLGYYLGVYDNPSKGRDLHAGSLAYDVITPISHVAALVPVIAGAAQALMYKNSDRVALTWIGDGSTRAGEFHEGVNYAAVARVPAVFVLQNNEVALGTRYSDHYSSGLEEMAEAYGVTGLTADGNNVLDIFRSTQKAVELCRQGKGPVFLTVNTFRMGGHATHDEAEARQIFLEKEFTYWGKRDPIGCYEEYLKALPINLETGASGKLKEFQETNQRLLEAMDKNVESEIESAAAKALENVAGRIPPAQTVLEGVWAS